jgi:hypothetical protein
METENIKHINVVNEMNSKKRQAFIAQPRKNNTSIFFTGNKAATSFCFDNMEDKIKARTVVACIASDDESSVNPCKWPPNRELSESKVRQFHASVYVERAGKIWYA